MNKIISVTTSCYNEVGNVKLLYERLSNVLKKIPKYDYEIIISDNNSSDGTQEELRRLALNDKKFKVIFNLINYGHIKSPFNSIKNSNGDCVIAMASDLEDPPELILEFVKKWEQGFKVVAAVRTSSDEPGLTKYIRAFYYFLMDKISETKQIRNFTGFGLYDREVINQILKLNDPNPYFRGIVSELGYDISEVLFKKPYRKFGISKGRFISNYDLAVQGIVRFSKFPLRLASFLGILMSFLSFIFSIYFLYMKLTDWDGFQAGMIPVILLNLFFFGVLFLILGLYGEYIYLLSTHIIKTPELVEREKINFDLN
jgi:glycosyltransferase involved in cell wall biosynthesis